MTYASIIADPAWQYSDKMGAMKSTGNGAASQYRCMTLSEVNGFPYSAPGVGVKPIGSCPNLFSQFAYDAYLWLWFTNAFAEAAHDVARAWGFTPKTIATWVKGRITPDGRLVQHICQGRHLRNSTEHCLLAVRGRPVRLVKNLPTAFVYPGRWKGRLHSEKPPVIHEWAERFSAGPYLEIFARRRRDGWDAIGDELDVRAA